MTDVAIGDVDLLTNKLNVATTATTPVRDLVRDTGGAGKLTIAATAESIVRDSGRLRCECGRPLRASDYQIEEDHSGIIGVRAVCAGCHTDLLEIEPC